MDSDHSCDAIRYFSSRPDLLSRLGQTSMSDETPLSSRAAASAVHNALASNPEATASLISSGLKHGSQNSSVKNSPFASAVCRLTRRPFKYISLYTSNNRIGS